MKNETKRERADSTATRNGHLNSQKVNTEALVQPDVDQTASPESPDMNLEPQDNFSMGSANHSFTAKTLNRREDGFSRAEGAAKTRNKESNTLEPPVTKATLSELDVNKIVHNSKLRHDINFDPDLHFRPNLDGDKGKRKTQKADRFWETMRIQLRDYVINAEQFEKECPGEWTLPATLKAIRGILETLVPHRDRASVEETLNVDHLMQQFRKGVADLPKLARWLSQLLKCHCAPMRDTWVDGMVTEISKGDEERDVPMLVLGLRNLLGVLEAMKLDVANHQIRCLRSLLIEDTVQFEQKFFMKKIAARKIDVAGPHAWFKNASPQAAEGQIASRGNFWDFMKALVNLVLPSKASEPPQTFFFDEERLNKLRADMEDMINIEICMQMFRSLDALNRQQCRAYGDTPSTSAPSSPPRSRSPAVGTTSTSSTSMHLPLPYHFAQNSKRQAQESNHYKRAFSGQQLLIPTVEQEQDHVASSAVPSPHTSPSTSPSTIDSNPPTPLYLARPSFDDSAQLRSALLAIISTSSTPTDWAKLAPSLALQILRSTTTPLTHLPVFESQLSGHFSKPTPTVYCAAEARVLADLFPVLQKLVELYTPMTSLQVFEAATAQKNSLGGNVLQLNGVKDGINEVATRLAHIGILHWRVWSPLVYLVDPDANSEEKDEKPVES